MMDLLHLDFFLQRIFTNNDSIKTYGDYLLALFRNTHTVCTAELPPYDARILKFCCMLSDGEPRMDDPSSILALDWMRRLLWQPCFLICKLKDLNLKLCKFMTKSSHF